MHMYTCMCVFTAWWYSGGCWMGAVVERGKKRGIFPGSCWLGEDCVGFAGGKNLPLCRRPKQSKSSAGLDYGTLSEYQPLPGLVIYCSFARAEYPFIVKQWEAGICRICLIKRHQCRKDKTAERRRTCGRTLSACCLPHPCAITQELLDVELRTNEQHTLISLAQELLDVLDNGYHDWPY